MSFSWLKSKGQRTFDFQQAVCKELAGSRRDNDWRLPYLSKFDETFTVLCVISLYLFKTTRKWSGHCN